MAVEPIEEPQKGDDLVTTLWKILKKCVKKLNRSVEFRPQLGAPDFKILESGENNVVVIIPMIRVSVCIDNGDSTFSTVTAEIYGRVVD